MSKGIDCINNSVLAQFLGTDGVEELRSKLIDMIVEEVHDQLRDSSQYILSPDDISSELYERVVEEIYDEIKEEYKEKIIAAMEKKLYGKD